MEYPSLSVWISAGFKPSDRGKPVALLNMFFHAGIFITPLAGGWVMQQFSLGTYLGGLIILAFTAAISMKWIKS
jgi:predicted MFS family arabinose efflux permease